MPEAFSKSNLAALPITSQELGRGGFFAPRTKIGLSNSPTTTGLIQGTFVGNFQALAHFWDNWYCQS